MSVDYWHSFQIIHDKQEFTEFEEFDEKFSIIRETFNLQYDLKHSKLISNEAKITDKNISYNRKLEYSELYYHRNDIDNE